MAKKISLDKFAKGALAERFNVEISKIMTNILDVNTKATAPRKLTITLDIKPNEERDLGNVIISAKSTLAASISTKTTVTIGYNKETSQGECQELNAEMVGQVDWDEFQREQAAKESNAKVFVTN